LWRVLGVWQIEQGYHDYSLLPFITTSPKQNHFFLCGLDRKKEEEGTNVESTNIESIIINIDFSKPILI